MRDLDRRRPTRRAPDERAPEPSAEDRDWIRRVERVYRAPELSPARREAFDARLRERLERRRLRRPVLAAAFAGALAGAVVAGSLWRIGDGSSGAPGAVSREVGEVAPAAGAAADRRRAPRGEGSLLLLAEGEAQLEAEALPAEYVAISGLFLGENRE